jgi:hypothetical protein
MRFPILKNTIRLRIKNVGVVLFACVILHNFVNAAGIPIPDYDEIEQHPDDDSADNEDEILSQASDAE